MLISFRLSQPVIFSCGSSKGVIGGSAGFHLVPELGYRVVFVRQKKTRPAQEQDGLLARWVGSLWLDECEEPAAAKFRAEERWYVVWFLAGPALGSDLLLRPTAVAACRVAVCALGPSRLYRSFRMG